MDENPPLLSNFEALLLNQDDKKPLDIYSSDVDTKISHGSTHQSEPNFSVKDILHSVASTLKDIQNADRVKYDRNIRKKLSVYKKNALLPLSSFCSVAEDARQTLPSNKFETQCVTNTQLISIVEDAEAMMLTDNDISQEFENSFCYPPTKYEKSLRDNANILHDNKTEDSVEISVDFNVRNKDELIVAKLNVEINNEDNLDKQYVCKESTVFQDIQDREHEIVNMENMNLQIGVEIIKRNSQESKKRDLTMLLDKSIELETNVEHLGVLLEEVERPASPVLSVNCFGRKPTSQCLVYDLEMFENFERMTLPLMTCEDATNLKKAEQITNSQISDKDFCLQTISEALDRPCSPILFKKDEESKFVNKEDSIQNGKKLDSAQKLQVESKITETYEDEILFSSDEEIDYVHKIGQDLPLTCALETSFYTNQSSILEKTIFVGFQTASNKSIQIYTHSLEKARSILEDSEVIHSELSAKSVTELVNKNVGAQIDIIDMRELKDNDLRSIEVAAKTKTSTDELKLQQDVSQQNNYHPDFKVPKDVKDCMITEENEAFVGFKTASNRNIVLSRKAKAKVKSVFQDININEVFEDEVEPQVLQVVTMKSSLKLLRNPKNERSQTTVDDSKTMLEDLDFSETFDNETEENSEKTKIIESSGIIDKKESCGESDYACVEFPKELTATLQGFKTASNKQITISNDALMKSKAIFQEIEKEVKHTETEKLEFIGFQTASNKKVEISKEAFAKSKRVFENIDNHPVLDANTDKGIRFGEFQIPSNKKVEISKEALAKTKHLFADIDNDQGHDVNNDKSLTFGGFLTASNKNVEISKEGLAKTKRIFADIDNNQVLDVNTDKSLTLRGFLTASHKKVKICDEALAKTKLFFVDIDNDPTSDTNTNTNMAFSGFKTANNKKVEISEEALAKPKRVFAGVDNDPAIDTKPNNSMAYSGFQTASNNKVIISDKALAETKRIFADIDNNQVLDVNTDKSLASGGFQTASHKKVKISDEALAKTKLIFADIDNDPISDTNTNTNMAFSGFQTASNKKVEISEEALAKSKRVFAVVDNDPAIETKPNKSMAFSGFQTASNKKVIISDKALAGTKRIFADIDNDPVSHVNTGKNMDFGGFQTAFNKKDEISKELVETKSVPENIVKNAIPDTNTANMAFSGFQTASNKKVKICENALVQSKRLFTDIDNDLTSDTHKNMAFSGFQTASNQKVEISKEALAQTKQIFADIDNDPVPDVNTDKFIAFGGFQTASNKKVVITDEMIAKAKNIFQDTAEPGKIDQLRTKPEVPCFKTGNHDKVQITEEALLQSRQLLAGTDEEANIMQPNSKSKTDNKLRENINSNAGEIDMKKFMDTQVMNNFDDALNTEDFVTKSAKPTKRAGSPILSCPKAKKQKCFKTPYKLDSVVKKNKNEKKVDKPTETSINFDQNYKKHKILNLTILAKLENESTDEVKIDPYICNFNYDDLLSFEFSNARNGIAESKLTIEDLKKQFLQSVNSKIVPLEWLDIQIRLILWKLISYEIRFPKIMPNACNAKALIDQLKYRYDRELYNVERPVLRKVMEKDETSARTMVLCVVGLYIDGVSVDSVTNPSSSLEFLLTDGWYTIRAVADRRLTQLACEGRIKVGGKLTTHGAELVGTEQGVAPWEDTSGLRLRLAGNSCRPAPPTARLGAHPAPPPPAPLRRVRAGGGAARVRVCLTRVYPQLYVERFDDGSTVTRSEKLEQIHQARYEADRQAKLERVYEDIEKEFAEQSPLSASQAPNESERDSLLQRMQERAREKIAAAGLDAGRRVVNLLKVRVADEELSAGLLSIWKPSDAILEIVREGSWLDVTSVVPTALRNSEIQLSAGRQATFRLTNRKDDQYKDLTNTLLRTSTSIRDICKNPNMRHQYNEIDTVGVVVSIEPSNKDFGSINNQHFQNVYLANADRDIICVNFWGGVKKFGFENVLKSGEIVSCSNLQKRLGKCRNLPQYRVTEFSFFTKTPKGLEARDMIEELVKKLQGIDRRKYCEECIELKSKVGVVKYNAENISPYRFNNTDYNLSKNKIFIDSPIHLAQNKEKEEMNLTGLDFESTFKQRDTQDMSPEEIKRKKIVDGKIAKLKMYGEPPPLSPVLVLNKSRNASSSYKSPLPEGLPINYQNAPVNQSLPRGNENLPGNSNNLPRNSNNLPRNGNNLPRNGNNLPQNNANLPKPTTTANEHRIYHQPNLPNPNLPLESPKTSNILQNHSSPLVLNRTYEKRSSVNPVKLNFSNTGLEENSVSVDHFAEEFDGSPPLSLD